LNLRHYNYQTAIKELELNYGTHQGQNSSLVSLQFITGLLLGPFLFMMSQIYNLLTIFKNGLLKLENIQMNMFKLH